MAEAVPELDCVTILAGEVTFWTETLLVSGYLNTDPEDLRSPRESHTGRRDRLKTWYRPEEKLALGRVF